MKTNRRTFFKQGAAVATIASTGDLMAATRSARRDRLEARDSMKDFGMKFALAMSPDSPRVPLAQQMDVMHAVSGVQRQPNLNPWDADAIKATKERWDKLGMKWTVVEGPPSLGEQTKLALSGRDEEIANFITFMKNLKKHSDVDVICYNWMPVISWFRSKMDAPGRGGALVTAFDYEDIKNKPLTKYGEVSKDALWNNLTYFLKAVVPEAEKIGMNLSLHPDDPQVDSIQGISRIMNTVENFDKMLKLVPSKYSGLTMCQGNFSLMGADIPALIHRWGKAGHINFVHFRNVQGGKFKFTETFHDEGQIDMCRAMKAYYDIGFQGTIRPDHVPTMAGEENTRPGYMTIGTLFAIGYMRGLLESIGKSSTLR
ncbi:mannonate dehydratase [Spirosoma montaniterrae]|uniref:mannonate dehydratase n=1 Tax=Spirosoma montaniterrae TaxID=1178516 RepID=A0A1P9WS88_9BACT|nr:mannonate dehydratase [Spirosoma montaniterrae]AQG78229.1 mannonate dehydratase [Spirosoma montaniterrae]